MPSRRRAPTEQEGADTDERVMGRAGTPAQGRELRARGQRTMRRLLDAGASVFAAHRYNAGCDHFDFVGLYADHMLAEKAAGKPAMVNALKPE